jgi:hypothetical protein
LRKAIALKRCAGAARAKVRAAPPVSSAASAENDAAAALGTDLLSSWVFVATLCTVDAPYPNQNIAIHQPDRITRLFAFAANSILQA